MAWRKLSGCMSTVTSDHRCQRAAATQQHLLAATLEQIARALFQYYGRSAQSHLT
jgi:hypothetical protein